MSFASDIKDELAGQSMGAGHCQQAELAAMISMDGQFLLEEDGTYSLRFHSESLTAARKYYSLLKKLFSISPEITEKKNAFLQGGILYRVKIQGEAADQVMTALGVDPGNPDGWVPAETILKKECCKAAFLRGAFLAAGSMSNPEKGYHFEISCTKEARARQLCRVMNAFGTEAKVTLRKKYHVVYLKESEQIVDILGVMSAHRALMELENIRILKEMRGTVNRQVNCEAANLSKSGNAAARQLADIQLIHDILGIDSLPDSLREIARVRMSEPEISLKELGELLNPPVGKSGVNHRLRKIKEIADELRREQKACEPQNDDSTSVSFGSDDDDVDREVH